MRQQGRKPAWWATQPCGCSPGLLDIQTAHNYHVLQPHPAVSSGRALSRCRTTCHLSAEAAQLHSGFVFVLQMLGCLCSCLVMAKKGFTGAIGWRGGGPPSWQARCMYHLPLHLTLLCCLGQQGSKDDDPESRAGVSHLSAEALNVACNHH